ncbi:hypothetical protein H9Q13_06115 [Pontibacter sp. JH31]|uniref:PH domain-containing protein n=1 Tax=Pontibacter aquaedesilientis TaxID=2766980 RepID=A0ABR7XFM9_9BACT|nr:hypothetical protein [Pontibacter aquaedesilientis]MBD1396736.1 hypothetical protein [Pontibacter aquaedesilientis]
MQEVRIRLFSRFYSVRSRVERALLLLALLSVALHGWLLFQLIAVRDLHSAMTFLYLFSLLPFSLFLGSVWLDRNPGYQRHLTLLATGVRYRLGFMQREQEFDWEEIELIELNNAVVVFELKNGERHEVKLASVDKEAMWQKVKSRLEGIAADKDIEYRLI